MRIPVKISYRSETRHPPISRNLLYSAISSLVMNPNSGRLNNSFWKKSVRKSDNINEGRPTVSGFFRQRNVAVVNSINNIAIDKAASRFTGSRGMFQQQPHIRSVRVNHIFDEQLVRV